MPYDTEDEIDWSDGTLHTPSPAYDEPDTAYMYPNPVPVDDQQYNSLFESDGDEKCPIIQQDLLPDGPPMEIAQPFNNSQYNSQSPIRHDMTSVRDCRRVPSREDYVDFALYQASQKAYEATILKQFVAHALHPDQIGKCFDDEGKPRVNINRYMALITNNVDKLANKMVWNAHHRVISMLANEGKESASFLHVHNLNETVFAGFGPGTTSRAARKLSESWHHAYPELAMVQLSTKEYPLDRHTHPLEDIDDFANTISNQEASCVALPTSPRKVSKRKKKVRNMLSAAKREEQRFMLHNNHLELPGIEKSTKSPTGLFNPEQVRTSTAMPRADTQSSHFEELNHPHLELEYRGDGAFADNIVNPYGANTVPTRLEMLFERHGADALTSDRAESSTEGHASSSIIEISSWPLKLFNDHKRRLTERWGNPPQALETLLPDFEQALAQTFVKGYYPTAPDWREKAQIIASRENDGISDHVVPIIMEHATTGARKLRSVRDKSGNGGVVLPRIFATGILKEPTEPSMPLNRPAAKKRKMETKRIAARPHTKQSIVTPRRSSRSGAERPIPPVAAVHTPLPPHPSGSETLELDQILPPDAYFEAKYPGEKPAWRCSIKHAMGHYYNAGDRKTCRGCNTSLMDLPKVKRMDFYMPRRQFFHQPAPGMRWKPCKPFGKGRKSDHPCHNSVAKDAFWVAINAGSTEDQARQIGCDAVIEFLRPKPRKEPTPEPEPEPEPDLGPHPSGSTTMEHGQDLPECAYWEKQERHEEFAWRCDVSHGLGRYYLAGDKKSCPGCGTNKGGLGRQTVMDFYLPPGTILRQEAPGLVKWKPRQYKARTSGNTRAAKSTKTRNSTHNQICAEKYFQAKTQGCADDEALQLALEHTDAWLDGKQDELSRKYEQHDDDQVSNSVDDTTPAESSSRSGNASINTSSTEQSSPNSYHRNSRGGCTVSLIPAKRSSDELSDEETDRADSLFDCGDGDDEGSVEQRIHDIPPYHEVFEVSSAEEESSGSDSE